MVVSSFLWSLFVIWGAHLLISNQNGVEGERLEWIWLEILLLCDFPSALSPFVPLRIFMSLQLNFSIPSVCRMFYSLTFFFLLLPCNLILVILWLCKPLLVLGMLIKEYRVVLFLCFEMIILVMIERKAKYSRNFSALLL